MDENTYFIKPDLIDKKIMSTLTSGPFSASALSRSLQIPRTTILYRLNRLYSRKCLEKSSHGKSILWKLKFNKPNKQASIEIYQGNNIIHAYSHLLNVPKQTTIYSIQGSLSAYGEFSNLPQTFIIEAHRIFKKKKIILKGVSNAKILSSFSTIPKELLKSHIGRSLGVKLFSNNLFEGEGELFLTDKILMLINPVKKVAVVITEPGIVSLVYDLYQLSSVKLDTLPSFDLNKYLSQK